MHRLLIVAMIALFCGAAVELPRERFDSSARVGVSVALSEARAAPGQDLVVAVVLDHDPGWHVHTHDPQVPAALGDASLYIATAVEVGDAGGALDVHAGFTQWPPVKMIDVAFLGEPVAYGVYAGRAVIHVPVTVAADAPPGAVAVPVSVTYQACDDTSCAAPVVGATAELALEVVPLGEAGGSGASAEALDAADVAHFADFDPAVWADIHAGVVAGTAAPARVDFSVFGWRFALSPDGWGGFGLLLGVAAVGGLLLNLTPCVLPVLPLKVMSLGQGKSRGRAAALGGVMSAGVVLFWVGLGLAIVSLTEFRAINELFQRPLFTIGVGLFIAVMAVGMCGAFSVGLPRWVYAVDPSRGSVFGSLVFGVMTAVLSTPCTAPLMGSAAAWAATQSGATAMSVFAAIGAGMAAPYLLLSLFPRLVKAVPKSGPWSELIKQVMGGLLLAAAIYFIGAGLSGTGLFTAAAGEPAWTGYWWAVAAVVVLTMGWLLLRLRRAGGRPAWRGLAAALALGASVGAVAFAARVTDPGPIDWTYHTDERLRSALAEGDTAIVDFTAEWCLNCKALEQAVLHREPVVSLQERDDVTFMKVDLTSSANEAGRALLESVGRVTIPALVVFAPDGEVVLNVDTYTGAEIVRAVERAGVAGG